MGAADSRLLQQHPQGVDQITTVSESRTEALDPCLARLQSLKVRASLTNEKARSIIDGRQAGPLLTAPSAESGLKEILLRQQTLDQSSVDNLTLDATTTAHLFSLFHEWQKENATKISKRQEDLGYRIEAVEALALKLLQRLTYSASVMKTTASHLEEVGKLQKDVKEMKQILQSAVESYGTLCKNINENGPDFIKGTAKPFSTSDLENVTEVLRDAVELRDGWMGSTQGSFVWSVNRRGKFKKRSGTASIVVEEIYLRDDIVCGSPLCHSCGPHLPHLPADASHYLIPNADAVVQFWEILELPQFAAVIFLTSVLKEVQARSNQRGWRRLKSIFTDRRRCNILFDDEHCIFTWLTFNEAPPDYLKEVAGWFSDHLEGAVPVVLLAGIKAKPIDSDFSEQFRTLKDGCRKVKVLDADTYFQSYWNHDSSVSELFASLLLAHTEAHQAKDGGNDIPSGYLPPKSGKATFKSHLSASSLEAGIGNGSLRVGTFFVSKHTPLEAFVRPSNKGEASRLEILVPGRALQNRALHGDTVAVRTRTRGFLEQSLKDDDSSALVDDDLANDVDEADDRVSTEKEALITGEVVGILQRVQREYVGCLAEEVEGTLASSARQKRLLCIPMDRRIPMVELTTRQELRLSKQRFVLRIDNWEPDSKYPRGHLVRLLGPVGDLDAEMMAILVENEIPIAPFSSLSLQELPEDTSANPWTIPEEEYASRRDIRSSHRSCSIDPPGSRDVDDVLSVSQLENGLLEVGVHIADVSYFVRQGSLLDLEARSRGTTVYMVGKSWHMLPAVLSENLCSLLGGKDRLALSVIWTLDPGRNFEVIATWFGRTIIRSQHQLFYAQAEAILEGKRLPPSWEIKSDDPNELARLQKDLMILATVARNRRAFRKLNGALELASTELRFQIDERKEPVQVETKVELPMNWIVAEMMIFANSCVAERVYGTFQTAALLRRHMPPKFDSFTMLLECCEARGFVLDVSSNKALAGSLDRMRDSGDVVVERAFRALITRAMSEAEYFSTGEELEPSHFYHYGLALRYYTHFTSPIRRYADILVHRMLIATCEASSNMEDVETSLTSIIPPIMSPSELQEVADHLNERHRASKRAQKECNELYLLMYLQKQAKAECGVIIGVTSKGLMVFVPKYDLRGPVYLEERNGQVILPEVDLNNSQEAGKDLQQYGLVKQKTSIKIIDLGAGKDLIEYKLMDTVWVRLRADGSRAHGPMLRMDLLGDGHPAVLAAQAEGISYSMSELDILSTDEAEMKRLNASSERKKAIEAMVDMVAANKASSAAEMRPVRKKKQLTMVDVLENVFRTKASYLYSNMDIGDGYQDASTFATALERFNIHDLLVSTPGHTEPAPAIDKENHVQLSLRRRWQGSLAQASGFRAKLMTSTSANDSERQQWRAGKELEARHNAELIQMQLFNDANATSR